ncbi:MAG TPA: ABC transporter permease [Gemmatimonadaceae bacterium]|nr:ABC transporter permease [Gemmatimonadaceae bacterium]
MRHRRLPVLALVAEGVAGAIDALEVRTLRTTLAVALVAASVCAVLVAGAAAHGMAIRVRRDAQSDGTRGFIVYRWPALRGRGAPLGLDVARALASLPQIAGAAAHQAVMLPVGAGDRLLTGVTVDAYDAAGGALSNAELVRGRWFTAAEHAQAAPVALINDGLMARLAAPSRALGAEIEIGHRRFRVIGFYHDSSTGFHAIVPLETARRLLGASPDWTDIVVRARDGVAMGDAMNAAAVRLRLARRAGDQPPDFVIAGAETLRAGTRIVPLVSRLTTGALSAVGLALAGLAMLLLMRRSVGDRTREIGVRKVLGATRAAILLEIVAESTTLATLGGLAGLAAGRGIAMLLAGATSIPASVGSAAALTALGLTIAGGAALGAPTGVRAANLSVLQALHGK